MGEITDNDIKKALECCVGSETCKNCPYEPKGDCHHFLLKDCFNLINRKDAEAKMHKSLFEDLKAENLETIKAIKNVKSEAIKEFADVAEVKHGEWVRQNGGFFFLCSVCGKAAANKGNYCHSCGAKMDGGS